MHCNIYYASLTLPFDIPEALKYGIIGFGAILSTFTFFLLRGEQQKKEPSGKMLRAIYVFMSFSILLILFGLLSKINLQKIIDGYFVPSQSKQIVSELPPETSGQYMLIKDISIFDLRGWKPVPVNKMNEKFSPANYINYLHLKKTQPLDSIVIHYGTSGYDIDLRCITHNYKNYQADTATADHKGQKSFGISIDVSHVPLNEEFLIVIEGTYWNGFRNDSMESAMTYTDKETQGLSELALIVLLPYEKPLKSVEKFVGSDTIYKKYRGADKFYRDESGRFVYWSIKDIEEDSHYKLDWTW